MFLTCHSANTQFYCLAIIYKYITYIGAALHLSTNFGHENKKIIHIFKYIILICKVYRMASATLDGTRKKCYEVVADGEELKNSS